jgi:hypothetical protein
VATLTVRRRFERAAVEQATEEEAPMGDYQLHRAVEEHSWIPSWLR